MAIMQTEVKSMTKNGDKDLLALVRKRIAVRMMSESEFIETHASGTLRKNKRLGFTSRSQYLHERAAFEFGYAFECTARNRVTFGDPFTEGDCKPLTEAGWHIDRYLTMSIFPEDYFEPKYIIVEDSDGSRREGVGIIVRQTSAPWVPSGFLVFAIIAEFNKAKGEWLPAVNPS